jgi:hypothetical protein
VGGDKRPAADAAHPFYTRLNLILNQHDFDGFVEGLCERWRRRYADGDIRPLLKQVIRLDPFTIRRG